MRRAILAAHGLLTRVLLPSAFRSVYGDELRIAVGARLESRRGAMRVCTVGVLECLDLFRTAAREWWALANSRGQGMLLGT